VFIFAQHANINISSPLAPRRTLAAEESAGEQVEAQKGPALLFEVSICLSQRSNLSVSEWVRCWCIDCDRHTLALQVQVQAKFRSAMQQEIWFGGETLGEPACEAEAGPVLLSLGGVSSQGRSRGSTGRPACCTTRYDRPPGLRHQSS